MPSPSNHVVLALPTATIEATGGLHWWGVAEIFGHRVGGVRRLSASKEQVASKWRPSSSQR